MQAKYWKLVVLVLILCLLYYPALLFSYCADRYRALDRLANKLFDELIEGLL